MGNVCWPWVWILIDASQLNIDYKIDMNWNIPIESHHILIVVLTFEKSFKRFKGVFWKENVSSYLLFSFLSHHVVERFSFHWLMVVLSHIIIDWQKWWLVRSLNFASIFGFKHVENLFSQFSVTQLCLSWNIVLLLDLLTWCLIVNGIHQPQLGEMIVIFLVEQFDQSIFISDFRMNFLFLCD